MRSRRSGMGLCEAFVLCFISILAYRVSNRFLDKKDDPKKIVTKDPQTITIHPEEVRGKGGDA